jgi:hypothetical protein
MIGRYNLLKQRALTVFAERTWLTPRAWAELARFEPRRAAYTYLKRLYGFDLLDRSWTDAGRLLYRINDRGRDRLRWLAEPGHTGARPGPRWTLRP